jgi:hypothetical protein
LLKQYGIPCGLWAAAQTAQEQLAETVAADPVAFADPAEVAALRTATTYIRASGLVSPTLGTARLTQVFRLTDVAADAIQHQAEKYGYHRAFASPAAVPFTLVQTNSAGQALASQEIYLVNDDDTGEIQYFLEVAPMAPDTTRVQIRQGNAVLAERSASANAPVVHLLAPNGGETLAPGAQVRWRALDNDGDPLSFTVQYSPDNGQTWRLIARRVISDNVTLPSLADLPGSTQGRIRVIANDGFLTGQDDSDATFTVPDSPPLAMILEPVDGAVVPVGDLVILSGLGTDVTDGPLGENSLSWRSDRDGPLGTGKEVFTSTLSPGQHRITLTATDSGGHTGAETINLYIGTRLYLPTILR